MRQFDNDVVDIASPISGINDSSYNSFPATTSYMGGFAPTVEPTPVYEEPINRSLPIEPQPVYQEPINKEPISGKCMRVIFSANRGFSAQAYWTDCSGQKKSKFVSVNETLEVDALDGTASGLPFMSYPIGSSPYEPQPQPYIPPYETAPAPIETAVEPIDPIFLMPVVKREVTVYDVADELLTPAMPIGTVYDVADELLTPAMPIGTVYDVADELLTPAMPTPPTPVDAIKTGVMPRDYIETKADAPSSPVQAVTPETPLPTKGVSKDLKPYIIAGVVVVGILIASRLLSKK
jgi:hypothetical protein